MSHSIFRPKREGPGLFRVLSIIVLAAAILGSGAYGYRWWIGQQNAAQAAAVSEVVADAERLIAEGNYSEADTVLAGIEDPVAAPAVQLRLIEARADSAMGQHEFSRAKEILETIQAIDANRFQRPDVQLQYARCLEDEGVTGSAAEIYETIIENATPELAAVAHAGMGRIALDAGDTGSARSHFEVVLNEATWGSDIWDEAVDVLGELNVAEVFSQKETPDSTYYDVQPGDTLTEVGKKLNTTQGMLIRANGLKDAGSLRVGQRLKHTHKDFRIVIERSTRTLYLFDAGGLFKRYRVGLGREGQETALGTYRIGNKQQDPDWFKAGEGRIPFGDPRNELGTRWMPLVPEQEELPRDLGIHGTWEDITVGGFTSSGCARLTNEEVEELYDLVVRATPVEVVETLETASDGQ